MNGSLGVFGDELRAEDRCEWCAGPNLPLPLDGHEDCFRRALQEDWPVRFGTWTFRYEVVR